MINNKEIELELFRKIQSGDEHAFTTIFNNYYEPLYRFAARIIREAEIAEGIVQEVYVKIWINKNKINLSYDLKTYLYSAVKNHCLNHIKKNKKFISVEETSENPSPGISVEEKFIKDEKIRAMNEAIERLPDRCKRIFMMKKYDELSYKEIAEILNISVNTVKTQMKRALKSLVKQLSHLKTIIFFILN